ncbi:hypothetical protein FKM82_026225 [Ascaphus truei]
MGREWYLNIFAGTAVGEGGTGRENEVNGRGGDGPCDTGGKGFVPSCIVQQGGKERGRNPSEEGTGETPESLVTQHQGDEEDDIIHMIYTVCVTLYFSPLDARFGLFSPSISMVISPPPPFICEPLPLHEEFKKGPLLIQGRSAS